MWLTPCCRVRSSWATGAEGQFAPPDVVTVSAKRALTVQFDGLPQRWNSTSAMTASSFLPAGILPLRTGFVAEVVTGVGFGSYGSERWRAAPFTSPVTSSEANRIRLCTVSRETFAEVDDVRRN